MVITLVPVVVPPGRGEYDGKLPPRMRWLNPVAARAYERIRDRVVVSDMYRSAESSLDAMRRKVGVLPPGLSRHGYGLAIDLSVGPSMKLSRYKLKHAFDVGMALDGWVCHRIDHKMGSEAWHYNYLGDQVWRRPEPSTRAAGERQLQQLYGRQMTLTPLEIQAALAKLGMYKGLIDGILGPLSTQAALAFSRAWCGKGRLLDAPFMRVLAFVAAELRTPDGGIIDVRSGTVVPGLVAA